MTPPGDTMDIEDIADGPAPSTSTVVVSKKRPREETTPKHDVMTSWRDQLGPVPSMGQSKVRQINREEGRG